MCGKNGLNGQKIDKQNKLVICARTHTKREVRDVNRFQLLFAEDSMCLQLNLLTFGCAPRPELGDSWGQTYLGAKTFQLRCSHTDQLYPFLIVGNGACQICHLQWTKTKLLTKGQNLTKKKKKKKKSTKNVWLKKQKKKPATAVSIDSW